MKLNAVTDPEAFCAAIEKCRRDVLLVSSEGDVLNLKSTLSRYLALGQLLSRCDAVRELYTDCREDERIMRRFLAEQAQSRNARKLP